MAKKIDFPCGVKPQAVALRIDAGGAEAGLLLVKMRVRALDLHMRCIVEVPLHEYRTGCADTVVGGTQVQIGRQRAVYQAIEFGVCEFLPPKRLRGLRDEQTVWGILHSCRRDLRCTVVGSNGAGGQYKRHRGDCTNVLQSGSLHSGSLHFAGVGSSRRMGAVPLSRTGARADSLRTST